MLLASVIRLLNTPPFETEHHSYSSSPPTIGEDGGRGGGKFSSHDDAHVTLAHLREETTKSPRCVFVLLPHGLRVLPLCARTSQQRMSTRSIVPSATREFGGLVACLSHIGRPLICHKSGRGSHQTDEGSVGHHLESGNDTV